MATVKSTVGVAQPIVAVAGVMDDAANVPVLLTVTLKTLDTQPLAFFTVMAKVKLVPKGVRSLGIGTKRKPELPMGTSVRLAATQAALSSVKLPVTIGATENVVGVPVEPNICMAMV